MAENTVKKIATRESYGNSLKELAEEFPNLVVLDADLAAATKTGIFRKAYPDRHIDCGIAESNMMGVAAGLSLVGKIPFVSSFAMFAAGRAFEQVRNSIGYPHLNVKIGATHAGITVGEDGATHQCNEDIALMRTIPGMVVMCPSDDVEARAAVRAALEYEGPVYIRFGRAAVPVINDHPGYHFEIGKGTVVREGKDVTIVATGICVDSALGAAKMLEEEGISRKWLDWIHTPVGLDIGAVTPEEIAVAILAEAIQVKRKPEDEARKVSQSDIDMEVIHDLAEPEEKFADQKKAVITILSTKGSTPRKAGAKMIVYETCSISTCITPPQTMPSSSATLPVMST